MTEKLATTHRQDLLLSFLHGAGPTELDPIRIMKGVFLFCQQAPATWEVPVDALYGFEAYMYGPYSPELASDLRELHRLGLITVKEAPGRTWGYYSLSEQGKRVVSESEANLPSVSIRYLATLRTFVCNLTFRSLLDTVYEAYPEYSVNSVFKSASSSGKT